MNEPYRPDLEKAVDTSVLSYVPTAPYPQQGHPQPNGYPQQAYPQP